MTPQSAPATFEGYVTNLFASAKTPHLFGDAAGVLTRGESRALVERIAHAIEARTVSLGRPASVAIHLPRDNAYLASIFAAWYGGHHYIPLNQSWPESHTRQILHDARPDLLITDGVSFEGTSTLQIQDAQTFPVPRAELVAAWKERMRAPGIAYVIYTSGSTGEQKGVVISKKAFTAYIDWVRRTLADHRDNLRLLINGEMSFDISLADLSFALAFETEVHISPDSRNMLAHARLLRDRRIDTFYGVPSTLNRLFSWARTRRGLSFDHVRTVFSGGDVLTYRLIDVVRQLAPTVRFYNMYGPTEVTMNCLYFQIPDSHAHQEGPVPTGRQFDHLAYELVDPETLAPVAGEGELLVSGDQCMEGYLNDPDSTAAAFVSIGGRRYYRTGDLFQKNTDGVYSILGRVDAIVKIKGYRINTTGIDSIVLGEKWVHEARTVVITTEQNDAQIITFLSLAEPKVDFAETLAEKCQAALPRYMVPAHFLLLDQLPQGKTGKVDTTALKALAIRSPMVSASAR